MRMVVGSLPERRTYAFTDPLGSGDPAGTRRRIRRGHGLIYGAAVPSLLLALLTDGGPLSERLAAGVAMAVTALVAVLMLAWPGMPARLLVAAFPLAALTVTAIAVLDPPLALTPMFYIWPLMTAGYFLRRREAILTYAVVCVSFGAASLWALDPGPRLMQWATVVIVGGVVMWSVQTLKEKLEALVTELRAHAREDPLTGALNRRAFLERLDAELARAGRHDGSCTVAILDVDHFKAINDRRGHAAGDAALRRTAQAIAGRLRRGDSLGRLGGDEFAVVLADTDADRAEVLADDLRGLVARDAAADGMPFTVSVGVASLPPGGASAEGLLAAADGALYLAKRAGRDTVRSAHTPAATADGCAARSTARSA